LVILQITWIFFSVLKVFRQLKSPIN